MTKLAQPDPVRSGITRNNGGRLSPRGASVTVAVTERALGALVVLRAAEHALPGQALGLVVDPAGSIGLVLDLPGALDRVFSRNDTPILFVEPELGLRLAGRILDHDGAPGEERFTLDRIAWDESLSGEAPRRS
jgi:hypothetical protein